MLQDNMFITHNFEPIQWEDCISSVPDTYTITRHLYSYWNCYWHFILSKRNYYKLAQEIKSDRYRAADVETIVSLFGRNLVNHDIKYIFVPRVVVCRDRSTTISQSHIRFTKQRMDKAIIDRASSENRCTRVWERNVSWCETVVRWKTDY